LRILIITLLTILLTVLGAVLTIKTFNLAATFTSAAVNGRPNQNGTAATMPRRTEIVPAPAIDRDALSFIGTGDGSAGSWAAEPQANIHD
jgi:hypothetical protein